MKGLNSKTNSPAKGKKTKQLDYTIVKSTTSKNQSISSKNKHICTMMNEHADDKVPYYFCRRQGIMDRRGPQ